MKVSEPVGETIPISGVISMVSASLVSQLRVMESPELKSVPLAVKVLMVGKGFKARAPLL